jgi:hypothetical protein
LSIWELALFNGTGYPQTSPIFSEDSKRVSRRLKHSLCGWVSAETNNMASPFAFARIFLTAEEFRKYAGVETQFVRVKSKGKVKVKYEIFDRRIQVEVDFADLEMTDCREILLLNEQGASFFTKYSDSSGLSLAEEKIGGLKLVTAKKRRYLTKLKR